MVYLSKSKYCAFSAGLFRLLAITAVRPVRFGAFAGREVRRPERCIFSDLGACLWGLYSGSGFGVWSTWRLLSIVL